jgi:hypothetical protein
MAEDIAMATFASLWFGKSNYGKNLPCVRSAMSQAAQPMAVHDGCMPITYTEVISAHLL